jgi:hypothetical protein
MKLQLTKLEKRFDLARYMEQFEYVMVGDNAVVKCPQCERENKLYVLMKEKLDTNGELVERGAWVCYYCRDREGGGTGRTCLSLIEWMESIDFVDAAKRLADGGTSADADFIGTIEKLLKSFEEPEDAKEPPPSVELPPGFIRIDEDHYPPYCAQRGISIERAIRFRLGYVPRKGGYCSNRLVAPVYFEGRVVGFQARYMKKKPPLVWNEKAGQHKRLTKTKHAFGAKMTRVLYNWDQAKNVKRLILIESPWAAIKIGRSGAATFGKHLSAAQLELIMKSDAEEVVFMWDRDEGHAPGKGGYDKSITFGERIAQVIPVRAVRMPDKRNPDELTLRKIMKLIERTPQLTANDAWMVRMTRRLSFF